MVTKPDIKSLRQDEAELKQERLGLTREGRERIGDDEAFAKIEVKVDAIDERLAENAKEQARWEKMKDLEMSAPVLS